MLNEQYRIYTVSIIETDGQLRRFRNRTRNEAKSAVEHWFPSWTTKIACVFNTKNRIYKMWIKTKHGTETKTNADPAATE